VSEQKTSGFLGKVLLFVSFLIFVGAVWWVIPPQGNVRYHLILTGISKGHITPYVSRFASYQDKNMGGAVNMAAIIDKQISDFQGQPFNVFSLGGELSGTPEAYFTKGQAVVDALNFFHLDGMLVGNIEFTFGQTQLSELSQKAKFPFISGNILEVGTEKPPSYIVSEKILYPGGNVKVGLIGITPPGTLEITGKSNVTGLLFLPPGPELKEKIVALRNSGANLIVVLSQYHTNSLSAADWEAIRQAKPDIFVMIDFNAEPPAPAMKDGILVKTISGYNQGKEIDVLDVDLSGNPWKMAEFSGRRIPVFCDQINPKPEVVEALDRTIKQVNLFKSEAVGEFSLDMERQYDRECLIGNLVTYAMREWFKGEVAFQNSGGIQSNIKIRRFFPWRFVQHSLV